MYWFHWVMVLVYGVMTGRMFDLGRESRYVKVKTSLQYIGVYFVIMVYALSALNNREEFGLDQGYEMVMGMFIVSSLGMIYAVYTYRKYRPASKEEGRRMVDW